ncbi:MAG: ATP-binding protein [Nakamurella sp.]
MPDESLTYLLHRVGLVEDRIRALVQQRRHDDPAPDDPFRGLYVTEDDVDRLLTHRQALLSDASRNARAVGETSESRPAPRGRLGDLAADAQLTALDVDLLVVALLPDLDSRFERLYGYLNDDVTRRRATVGMALAVVNVSPAVAAARARLLAGSPLIDRALVQIDDSERPFLTRALRVPDRVTAHLLGDDAPDPSLVGVLTEVEPLDCDQSRRVSGAMATGRTLAYIRESGAGVALSVAAAAMAGFGCAALGVDLSKVRSLREPVDIVTVIGREALLRGAGVVAGPIEALAESELDAVRRLAELPVPVAVVGTSTWDPNWTARVPLLIDAPLLTPTDRLRLWTRALAAAGAVVPDAAVPVHFVLGPGQVARAVRAAEAAASLDSGTLDAPELRRGARTQNAAGLERLARRVEPGVGWTDIVLPESALSQLQELASRARHRDQVLVEWGMRPGGGRGRGVTALFAGDSGTGKTMSAEVIARDLGLDLYTVNLATVVDKYIGETEKNLERIFTEADGVNAVLLFDEADAIFGKRSEVRDAHDRYANIESAYLLQRMETFDGLAILSTNLRSNIDDAFTRRLDMIIDFPAPDETSRLAIWERCLAPPAPCLPGLDLEFCARSFTLSGGNIRSAATTAAYLAAGVDGAIGMPELIAAVQQEYRKLGRLVLEREFGHYLGEPAHGMPARH